MGLILWRCVLHNYQEIIGIVSPLTEDRLRDGDLDLSGCKQQQNDEGDGDLKNDLLQGSFGGQHSKPMLNLFSKSVLLAKSGNLLLIGRHSRKMMIPKPRQRLFTTLNAYPGTSVGDVLYAIFHGILLVPFYPAGPDLSLFLAGRG